MPRPLWRGALSFGLVNVPVAVVPATRSRDVRFHQLDPETHRRVEVQRFCTAEQQPIPYDEIARGYEVEPGEFVLVTDEELEAIQPEKTRTIEISEFVELAQVDPAVLDRPYWLVPDGRSEGALRAYRLLVRALERCELAALGHVVIRTREHLAAVRARDGALALQTLHFADEVRPTADLPLPGEADQPGEREIAGAVALIQELSVDFDPERYPDRHRERLLALVERKAAGETIEVPEAPEQPAAVPDLMAALRESLEQAKGRERRTGDRRHPSTPVRAPTR